MSINSWAKGKRFELELASRFRDYGYDARRGQQYSGATGDAVVIGLPGIHVEAKRRERMELYDWMAQAKADAKAGELPAVFHRKSNCEVLVTMELDVWMQMYRAWELEHSEQSERE